MDKNEIITAPITKEDLELITKLKLHLKSKQVDLDYNYFDDWFFYKFLKARKFDINKTYEMLTGYLKWFFEYDGYNSQVYYINIITKYSYSSFLKLIH